MTALGPAGVDREAFVAGRKARWERLDLLLGRSRLSGGEWAELARLYRAVAADLSRAHDLGLGHEVVAHLDELAGRAHNAVYGARQPTGVRLLRLLFAEFPRELRAGWPFFAAAMLLFYVPMIVGLIGAIVDPTFAPRVLPPDYLRGMEDAYASSDMARHGGEDTLMAGFYVMNNVGIALRCFATGAIFGLGPIFYLPYNGLVLGTVGGQLAAIGEGPNLLSYIAGHSPWELTGVVVSGTAGLRLGWAMVETGGRTRAGSLRAAGPGLVRLVAGTTALLLVAASIEAFWSAGPFGLVGKLIFGAAGTIVVAVWLGFGGRGA